MDPLSDVLSLVKLTSFWSAGFDAGGDWSIAFDQSDGIKFYAAVSGECWLTVDGIAEPLHVRGGDCLLLPRGRAFVVGSDPALEPVALRDLNADKAGGVTVYNGGGDFFSVGGQFTLSGEYADTLLAVLPPVVHIHDESDKAVLRWCLERMRQELREPQPGGFLVAQQLATMILVQALRAHLAEGARDGVGWLFALADAQLSLAMRAIHADPAHPWTVQSLAQHANMSRTSFALKFKERVGSAPMEYLTRWRMMLAGDRLANSNDPVSEIAQALGYDSESAFSTAFKRVMGRSPRRYGRDREARPVPVAM